MCVPRACVADWLWHASHIFPRARPHLTYQMSLGTPAFEHFEQPPACDPESEWVCRQLDSLVRTAEPILRQHYRNCHPRGCDIENYFAGFRSLSNCKTCGFRSQVIWKARPHPQAFADRGDRVVDVCAEPIEGPGCHVPVVILQTVARTYPDLHSPIPDESNELSSAGAVKCGGGPSHSSAGGPSHSPGGGPSHSSASGPSHSSAGGPSLSSAGGPSHSSASGHGRHDAMGAMGARQRRWHANTEAVVLGRCCRSRVSE